MFEHSHQATVISKAFEAGTVQVRVKKLPGKDELRKNTGPLDCATLQFAPVVSSIGWILAGIEKKYCKYAACQSPYVMPKG
jgi:hypothetical protein